MAALWHFRPQLGRGPLAGALFFAVTLLPVLGFVDYGYMQYTFVADRFQYLAGIGVLAVVIGMAACGVGRLSDLWQKGALGVAAMALVVLGMMTWRQASVYRDNETLNRHIIALNPQARDAHLNLGILLYNQARYEEALEMARIAVEQRPDYSKTHDYLGAILNVLGRFEEAETHLRRAIALNPQEKYAHFNLGNTLCEQGRFEEALEAARVAVEQRPDFARAHTTLSIALTALGRFEEAEAHLRRAIALDPRTQNVHLNLGMTLYYQADLRSSRRRPCRRRATSGFRTGPCQPRLGSQCAGTLRGGRNSSAPCLGTQPARCILFPEIDRKYSRHRDATKKQWTS